MERLKLLSVMGLGHLHFLHNPPSVTSAVGNLLLPSFRLRKEIVNKYCRLLNNPVGLNLYEKHH